MLPRNKHNTNIYQDIDTDNIDTDDIALVCKEMAGNSNLEKIIKKLEKIKENRRADTRIKEYNRSVDIIMKRYQLGMAFNDTIVNMINSELEDILTIYIVGFIDTLPRQMIEIMCHKIGDDTDNLSNKIICDNRLRYILYDSHELTTIYAAKVLPVVLNIMNIIKDASRHSNIYLGSYKITDVIHIHTETDYNINYQILAEDDSTGDTVFVDFWLQGKNLVNDINIAGLSINNNGIVARIEDFNTINAFEETYEHSILHMQINDKLPIYGGFFWMVNDIFNNRGVIFNKKKMEKNIEKLNTQTLTRSQKVKLMLDIISFYTGHIDQLIPKYINKTNMKGLPDYYIETEEECLYTAIAPPYIKLKLECGHDMSIQSLYGLLVEGYNDDSELIVCQLCSSKLVFKLVENAINSENIYPHVYTYNELNDIVSVNKMISKKSVSNKESIEFVNNMVLKYNKIYTQTEDSDLSESHDGTYDYSRDGSDDTTYLDIVTNEWCDGM
jgi:hypothetical protein